MTEQTWELQGTWIIWRDADPSREKDVWLTLPEAVVHMNALEERVRELAVEKIALENEVRELTARVQDLFRQRALLEERLRES